MGLVRVEDVVLWITHIERDERLQRKLFDLPADATIALNVGGRSGLWQKMKDASAGGRPTSGLKPQGDIKAFWSDLYTRYKREGGIVVSIEDPDPATDFEAGGSVVRTDSPRVPIEFPDPTLRAAARERIGSVRRLGWTSSVANYGSRDEWYAEDGI